MSNVIVHMATNHFLAVDSSSPAAGDPVKILPFSHGTSVYAFWEVINVNGGQFISLEKYPSLFMDLNASSPEEVLDKTGLVINSTPNFANSNLWSTANLPTIISLCGSFKVIDEGSAPEAVVWRPLLTDNQEWVITTFNKLEGKIDPSLLS